MRSALSAALAGAVLGACSSSNGPKPNGVAEAGAAQDVALGRAFTLDGSGSSDPDGNALSYVWTQVHGPDVTGGAGTLTGATPGVHAPPEVGTLVFELRVDDGNGLGAPDRVQIHVLEDPSAALFVDGDAGNDARGDGTRAAPYASIAKALEVADAAAVRPDLYLRVRADGAAYRGGQTLPTGTSIYGGYGADWVRDTALARSRVEAETTGFWMSGVDRPAWIAGLELDVAPGNSNAVVGIQAMSGTAVLFIEDNAITAQSLGSSEPYATASIGVLVYGIPSVAIRANHIVAGAGVDGGPGSAGGRGADGLPGSNADATFGYLGGHGATSGPGYDGGTGGIGGSAMYENGRQGAAGGAAEASGCGGGGYGGGTGSLSEGGPGHNGCDGAVGAHGWRGAGGGAPLMARGGQSGDPGAPGGGGGGGGGGEAGGFLDWYGAGGGGGGTGGGGGEPGQYGWGGGASAAVAIFQDVQTVVLLGNMLEAGNGGAGGAAGEGGSGGAGGDGGNAGSPDRGHPGGPGGKGGYGGAGGKGGAGGGGPSYGVFVTEGASLILTDNVIVAGDGGAGGDNGTVGHGGEGGYSFAVFDESPGDGANPAVDATNVLFHGAAGPGGGPDGVRGQSGNTNF